MLGLTAIPGPAISRPRESWLRAFHFFNSRLRPLIQKHAQNSMRNFPVAGLPDVSFRHGQFPAYRWKKAQPEGSMKTFMARTRRCCLRLAPKTGRLDLE